MAYPYHIVINMNTLQLLVTLYSTISTSIEHEVALIDDTVNSCFHLKLIA